MCKSSTDLLAFWKSGKEHVLQITAKRPRMILSNLIEVPVIADGCIVRVDSFYGKLTLQNA